MAIYVNSFNKNQTDDSGKYSVGKNAIMAIANPFIEGSKSSSGKYFKGVLLFKCFIESFSFDRAMKQQNFTQDPGDIYQEIRGIGALDKDSFKFDIVLTSGNLNESLANHYKMQYLYRILGNESISCTEQPAANNPAVTEEGDVMQAALVQSEPNGGGGGEKESVAVGIHIYLANLLSSHPDGSKLIPDYTHSNVIKYGLPGIIEDCTYQPNMELGFYEYKGRIFAKVFTLSFTYVIEGPGVSSRFEPFVAQDGETYWRSRKGDSPRPFGFNEEDYSDILKNNK